MMLHFEIRQTEVFSRWLNRLKDEEAVARIFVRVRRLADGNVGDAKAVGGGVSELRIDYGPGYRVYFTRKGREVLLLLCGGDKRTQDRDIVRAKELAKAWQK